MMMPANFSAVAENEMSYVIGGGIADVLADPMGTAQWKKFNTNLVTVIGNNFMKSFLHNSIGQVFSGCYVPGDVIDAFGSKNGRIWNWATGSFNDDTTNQTKAKGYIKGALNIGLNVVGNLAAIYNLGFGTVKNAAEKAAIAEFTTVATV